MKTTLKTRLLALLLCLAMLFLASCGSTDTTPQNNETTPDTENNEEVVTTPQNGAAKIVTQNRTLYINTEVFEEVEFAHYEDYSEVLLMSANEACKQFIQGFLAAWVNYEYEETETTLVIKRDNGSTCTLDFVEDTVYFDNYDTFFMSGSASNFADQLASSYTDEEGNNFYFKREESLETHGRPILIDLAAREIPLDIYEGVKYLPFQTFNDLFLLPYNYNFAFNSEDVFFVQHGAMDAALQEIYYSVEPGMRSEALAEFTFKELCLILDLRYGLQDEHGVTVGFENYFILAGLYDDLMSTDPMKFTEALTSLSYGYLADQHSGVNNSGPYAGGAEINIANVKVDQSIIRSARLRSEYANARAEAIPDLIPYQEIGNTAYITFDSFTIDGSRFSNYDENSATPIDTLGLIIYAHSMINREGSPVENVVLDLSCNGGGAFDAAVYVVGWMIGYCDVHFVNPISEGKGSVTYKVDVNLDNQFDENDTIADKNLYCIISPNSFSCGNLVPALLKESGKVTLIGRTSGGGACVVQSACTADGNIWVFSSPFRLSVVSNGSYYNIDRGVDPDIYLSKLESFYDREALTEYINSKL